MLERKDEGLRWTSLDTVLFCVWVGGEGGQNNDIKGIVHHKKKKKNHFYGHIEEKIMIQLYVKKFTFLMNVFYSQNKNTLLFSRITKLFSKYPYCNLIL